MKIYLEQVKTVAEIIQALGIGIGSFLGGLGALKVLGEWRDKRKYRKLKRKWLRLYPKDKLGKEFRLLYHSYSEDSEVVIGSSDHVYLCDERTTKKHWVVNLQTLEIMGFNREEAIGVSQAELNKYAMGEQIDLTPLQ